MFNTLSLFMMFVGFAGLLGSTILFPALAALFHNLKANRKTKPNSKPQQIRTIDILIPAHNEESHLSLTLTSIIGAIDHLKAAAKDTVKVQIIVAADACNDKTEQIALLFADKVFSVQNRSKFRTLENLAEQSSADWISLVDVGTIWPKEMLVSFLKQIKESPKAIAFAPSYKTLQRSSQLMDSLWFIERGIKELENLAGGPVSVHGATVLYQRKSFNKVLKKISHEDWLNDDVVIPLCLRAQNENCEILYSNDEHTKILDVEQRVETTQSQQKRRIRIVAGNIQWIVGLLPYIMSKNTVVGLVSLRRLFRVFWAWWATFISLSITIVLSQINPVIGLSFWIGMFIFIWSAKSLRVAFAASLMAPSYLVPTGAKKFAWK
jgi:cellulose synthase/poly-beta-1,6-N-acetylglucosamine synthase-like glycosyltransferase